MRGCDVGATCHPLMNSPDYSFVIPRHMSYLQLCFIVGDTCQTMRHNLDYELIILCHVSYLILNYFLIQIFFLIVGAMCQMIREGPDYGFVILRHVSYPILKYLIFTLHKYGGIYSIISHTLIQLTPISFHKIIFFFVLCNNYLLLLQ